MELLGKIIISALAVIISSALLHDVHMDGALTALIVAGVLSLLNAFVKPVLVFFTIPFTILSLGLFLLVINAVIILVTDRIVDGFKVDGFGTAILFSIILSLTTSLLNSLNRKKSDEQN